MKRLFPGGIPNSSWGNFASAVARFEQPERCFRFNPKLRDSYVDIIRGWEQKNYVERLLLTELGEQYFLPHFPVVRLEKETTKVRVVLDAKAEFDGKSLNDCVLHGPK